MDQKTEINHKLEYQNCLNVIEQNKKVEKLIDNFYNKVSNIKIDNTISVEELHAIGTLLIAQNELIKCLNEVVMAYSTLHLHNDESFN